MNEPLSRFIGGTLKLLGTAAFGFAALSLGVGIIGLFTEDLAAILLVAVPPLAVLGLLGVKAGEAIAGRKFKMKKWTASAA